MPRRSLDSFSYLEAKPMSSNIRASSFPKKELPNTLSDVRAADTRLQNISQEERDLPRSILLPCSRANLLRLQEQFAKMEFNVSAASASPAISTLARSSELVAEMQSDICSTCYNSESDPAFKISTPRNHQDSVFCCANNKIICVGPGIDEGDNRAVIERFIKDVSHHEERYLSKEDIKDAFLACRFVIEVQRTVEEKTQTRYFVQSVIYKKKYVEVNPRDMFYANPLHRRNDHVYMFVKCGDRKHEKNWVARRVTILEKPHFMKGTEVYKESSNEWFVSGVVEEWGQIFYADDE